MPVTLPEDSAAILALIYDDGAQAERALRGVAGALAAAGLRPAGFVQRDEPVPGRSRCDMVLDELWSGERIIISEDRGPGATGCRLVPGELLRAVELVSHALSQRPDAVLLNKFGKSEAEGAGLRSLIGETLAMGVKLVIGVPRRNLDAWHAFTEGLSEEVDLAPGNAEALAQALRRRWPALHASLLPA